MAKKIFDIMPPEIWKRQQEGMIHPKKKKRGLKKEKSRKSKKFYLKEILISGALFFVLVSGFFYFKLPRVSVEIWPKTELLTSNEKITIATSANEVSLTDKLIPGQFVEIEKDLWQEYPATGTKSNEGKAKGTIRVYNKYNPPALLSLKAQTRFISDSGKVFRSLGKIYLPPAQIKGGKVVPSWTDVEVMAAEAGEEYNIRSANFSVPGLSGTAWYYSVYAESSADMTGGFKSDSKQATEEDLQAAKEDLEKKILDGAESALREKITSDYVLLDGAISKNIFENSCLVKAGAEVEKFSCQAKARARALVFKESDLKKFAKGIIMGQVSKEKSLSEQSLNIKYSPDLINLDDGKIVLNLELSGKIYSSVNKYELSVLFKDKSSEQLEEIISNVLPQQTSQIKIKFWPFWVKKAPRDATRINVELKLE